MSGRSNLVQQLVERIMLPAGAKRQIKAPQTCHTFGRNSKFNYAQAVQQCCNGSPPQRDFFKRRKIGF